MDNLIMHYIEFVEPSLTWATVVAAAVSAAHQYYMQRRAEKRAQRREKREERRQSLSYRVSEATKAGINPLAALGINMGVGSGFGVGHDSSMSRDLGKAVGGAVEKITDGRYDKQIKEIAIEQERAKATNLKLETISRYRELYGPIMSDGSSSDLGNHFGILGQGNSAASGVPNNGVTSNQPGLEGQKGAEMVSPEVSWSMALGIQAGIIPLNQWNWREDRTIGLALTEQFKDSMEDDLGFKYDDYAARIKRWLKGYAKSWTRRDSAMRKRFNAYWAPRLPKLPKSHMWLHLPHSNRWKAIKKGEYQKQMRKLRSRDSGDQYIYKELQGM